VFRATNRLRVDLKTGRCLLDGQTLVKEEGKYLLLLLTEGAPRKIRKRFALGPLTRIVLGEGKRRALRRRLAGALVDDRASNERQPRGKRSSIRIEGPKKSAFVAKQANVGLLDEIVDVVDRNRHAFSGLSDCRVDDRRSRFDKRPPCDSVPGNAAGKIGGSRSAGRWSLTLRHGRGDDGFKEMLRTDGDALAPDGLLRATAG
jgi:hypothetical protein